MLFHTQCQRFARWSPLLAAVAITGCSRDDVRVYSVPKETAQTAAAVEAQPAPLPAGHPEVSGAAPSLQWKLPAGWEEVAPGEMRAASFRVKGPDGKQADVGVFPLPGQAGTDLANVNRWRAQVGLPPITEAEMQKLAEPVEIAGQTAQIYEQAGQNPGSDDKTRILAAILRRPDVAWFFKMTGDDALVARQKPAFVEFLKSATFPPVTAQAQLPPSHPPIDAAGMGAAAGAEAAPGAGKPAWQVPSGWQEAAAGQFLVAKFLVRGSGSADAAVNVSMSAGDGGGVAANVNRWRAQLGLVPLADADLPKQLQSLNLASGKATLVDMTGTDPRSGARARLLAAIVPQENQTWFYKLMGNEQLVEQERGVFLKFVQTARY